jgi:pimeloyl-ACP methyl ester carboxylesterase
MLSLARPRLRLRTVEVGAGGPAVFLHGYGLCVAHWAPLVSRLAGVRSLLLDAPGHGEADAVNFNGVDLRAWYKEMLTGCLDALGIEQVCLIGHSMGAMQALWFALDAPNRVRSVGRQRVPRCRLRRHA